VPVLSRRTVLAGGAALIAVLLIVQIFIWRGMPGILFGLAGWIIGVSWAWGRR
jgi:hypothetical protein